MIDQDHTILLTSMVSNEARHTAYLRTWRGHAPSPNPFDTPLDLVDMRSSMALLRDNDSCAAGSLHHCRILYPECRHQ